MFVRPEHQVPLHLALSLYTHPIEELAGYKLVYATTRFGIWIKDNHVIVGCKGTTATHKKDLADDAKLATSANRCDLSLVREVMEHAEFLAQYPVTFSGHSLGGAAAMCLATKFPNSLAVVYNAAAPPTNPVLSGPGPHRAVHYHVMGDGISSHMSPDAATIVRVEIPGPKWGYAFPHAVERLYATQYSYVSADQEQASWIRDGAHVMKYFGIVKRLAAQQFVCAHPIPGSTQTCTLRQRLLPF